jgi:hypothetical protein
MITAIHAPIDRLSGKTTKKSPKWLEPRPPEKQWTEFNISPLPKQGICFTQHLAIDHGVVALPGANPASI